jgi:tRNA1Val (adenine37-N6)-methyltransferase
MKVCTDACLFGAFVAHCQLPIANCLDIGTGTGLLSLMYAQQNSSANIDAVEINAEAAMQAKENFEVSPWKDKLHIINTDIKNLESNKKYDLIISNPPFFEDDLRSADKAKNAAKHDTALSLEELLSIIDAKLNMEGSFAVLLPYHRVAYFETAAAKTGLHLNHKILVRQTPTHDHFRGILFFSREKSEMQLTEIIIRNGDGNYSEEFIELLKDYYLNL